MGRMVNLALFSYFFLTKNILLTVGNLFTWWLVIQVPNSPSFIYFVPPKQKYPSGNLSLGREGCPPNIWEITYSFDWGATITRLKHRGVVACLIGHLTGGITRLPKKKNANPHIEINKATDMRVFFVEINLLTHYSNCFLDVVVGLQEFERKKWQFLDSSSLGKCVDSVIRIMPSERNTYNKCVPLSKEISPLKNHRFLRNTFKESYFHTGCPIQNHLEWWYVSQ